MENIEALLNLIDEACEYLVQGDMRKYSYKAQQILDSCFVEFPKIIVAYSDAKMADIADEATYWPSQLERIINAINDNDRFKIFDILRCETRENLSYIMNEMLNRGVKYGNV